MCQVCASVFLAFASCRSDDDNRLLDLCDERGFVFLLLVWRDVRHKWVAKRDGLADGTLETLKEFSSRDLAGTKSSRMFGHLLNVQQLVAAAR